NHADSPLFLPKTSEKCFRPASEHGITSFEAEGVTPRILPSPSQTTRVTSLICCASNAFWFPLALPLALPLIPPLVIGSPSTSLSLRPHPGGKWANRGSTSTSHR